MDPQILKFALAALGKAGGLIVGTPMFQQWFAKAKSQLLGGKFEAAKPQFLETIRLAHLQAIDVVSRRHRSLLTQMPPGEINADEYAFAECVQAFISERLGAQAVITNTPIELSAGLPAAEVVRLFALLETERIHQSDPKSLTIDRALKELEKEFGRPAPPLFSIFFKGPDDTSVWYEQFSSFLANQVTTNKAFSSALITSELAGLWNEVGQIHQISKSIDAGVLKILDWIESSKAPRGDAVLRVHDWQNLPARVRNLYGRQVLLEQVCEIVRQSNGAVVEECVFNIHGTPGVGKSSFALGVGDNLRSYFNGGLLYFKLKDLDAATVRNDFLTINYELSYLEAQSELAKWDLYRSAFNARTKMGPILLILDDATSETQIRNLIPPSTTVIATSQSLFASGKNIHLPALEEHAAMEMLRHQSGREIEDSDAHRITGYCLGLPLALQQAAAQLKTHPAKTTGEFIEELEANRFEALPDVYGVFESSYLSLVDEERSAMCVLSIMPAPFDRESAKAVAACSASTLDNLIAAGLIDYDANLKMLEWHDLIREFAASKLDAVRSAASLQVHAFHYARGAVNAVNGMFLHSSLSAWASLEKQFSKSMPHFELAFQTLESDQSAYGLLQNFTGAVRRLAGRNGALLDRVKWCERHLRFARGFALSEISALESLADALAGNDEFERAVAYLKQALALIASDDDMRNVKLAPIFQQLAYCYRDMQKLPEAIVSFRKAAFCLRQFSENDKRHWFSTEIADCFFKLHQWAEAGYYYKQALTISSSGRATESLAVCRWELGRRKEALKQMDAAITMYKNQNNSFAKEMAERRKKEWIKLDSAAVEILAPEPK